MKLPKFLSDCFRFSRGAAVASLGVLERETMDVVWQEKEVSVRQVAVAFDERLAYTTVMTTLDRLYKKGFLNRRKEGRAFLYAPRYTADELELGMTENVIGSLLDTATEQIEPVLACIVDAVSERDLLLLDELERLVREKRREIENTD
ncbi:MAG: BlaI/MecI/CopY family transcriptional regulator [Acidobacteriota bacterium]|nr:BlaI/MecI/CopY family transcriptional regulator [Acidobacteriota bacterium]